MKRTAIRYLILSGALFGLTRVYVFLSRGISSWAMESTALVALAGGLIQLIMLRALPKDAAYRGWLTLTYHAALAFLLNYLLIEGILQIAGGSSAYAGILLSISIMFGLVTLGLILFALIRKKNVNA